MAPTEVIRPAVNFSGYAGAPHGWDHHLADGGDGRGTCSRDRAEDGRSADRSYAQASAYRADTRLHEIDQPPCYASAAHQFAGIDKERDREQWRRINGSEQILVHHHQRHIHEKHEGCRYPGQKHHEDGEAQQQKQQGDDKQREGHSRTAASVGTARSPFRRVVVMRRHPAKSKIMTKPSATKPCGIHIGIPAMSLDRPILSIWEA